ncbi:MAG TPA: tetratricopeptide repeat protein [Kiritimatiellia bacterium]|nr:tetratricopeptide repeat protein [Kiritimatiellia bacterium]
MNWPARLSFRCAAGCGAAALLALAGGTCGARAGAPGTESLPDAAALDNRVAEMEKSARDLAAIEKDVRKNQAEVEQLTRALARQEAEAEIARERAQWAKQTAALERQLEERSQALAQSAAEIAGLRAQAAEAEKSAVKRQAELDGARKEIEALRAQLAKASKDAEAAQTAAAETLRRREAQWQAEGLVRQGKALREQLEGVRDASLAWSLNDAGLLLLSERRWDEAADLFRRALTILETTVGRTDVAAGTVLQHLADVARAKGEGLVAEAYYREAAETFRAKLGAAHPRYAAALNGWACALRDMKRPADAEALYRQAIDVYEKSGRRDGAALAIPLYNLGMLKLDQGQTAEAEPLFEKAVRLAEKSRATNREAYLIIVRGLVRYYRASGQMDQATQAEQKAMDVLIE